MIVITGASGHLGREVIAQLVRRVPAAQVVAAVRSVEKAKDLEAMGVEVRQADYAAPETLQRAFAGAEKVLLISSNEVGQRVPQHQAVIDAAKAAGAQQVLYTSILNADRSTLALADEHKATEAYLRSSGLGFVLLRNGWYFENQTAPLPTAIEHGAILGAAQNGRFAAATRADYAGAAVAALVAEDRQNRVYELAGDQPYTLDELAAEASKQSGKTVVYKNLPTEAYAQALVDFGLPEPVARAVADADRGAGQGELDSSSADLRTLLGRPTTSLEAAVAAALRG